MGDRGVFGNRLDGLDIYNILDYITISSAGNATDFGDLTLARERYASTSNGENERGIFAGGYGNTASPAERNIIDYITINSAGNATDFGDLLETLDNTPADVSNGSDERGLIAGGTHTSTKRNVIQYITINSAGNAVDFGDLTIARMYLSGVSNGTAQRGCFGGGQNSGGSNVNTIDYVTINSIGNATDFGDLLASAALTAGLSNFRDQRGCFAGNQASSNVIQYITINSPGNGTDFGDLILGRASLSACSNGTAQRGCFGGGSVAGTESNVIDYITINSEGNASDFGDLTHQGYNLRACSNADTTTITIPIYLTKWMQVDLSTMPKIMNVDRETNQLSKFMLIDIANYVPSGGYSVIGVFAAGKNAGGTSNVIDYIVISTTGNATDFGDTTTGGARRPAGTSDGTNQRGVYNKGYTTAYVVNIDYITINSPGNATDFGDLSYGRGLNGTVSNNTSERAYFAAGQGGAVSNRLDYVTINSTGNATDAGDLTVNRAWLGGLDNGTNDRGVCGGGINVSTYYNVIDYWTISSTNNASDFGDLSADRSGIGAGSNLTNERGLFTLGWDGSTVYNVIEYITINSTGNSTDFGDLSVTRREVEGASAGTNNRVVFAGGLDTAGTSYSNVMDYVDPSSTGNATDFGDLTEARHDTAAMSNA